MSKTQGAILTIEKKMAFRFQGKNLFLTYSRCDVSREDILAHVKSLVDVEEYLIAQEPHYEIKEDKPNVHIHAWFRTGKKLDIKNDRYFDLRHFHPNFKNKKKSEACDYLCNPYGKKKVLDENPISNFVIPRSYIQMAISGDVKGAIENFRSAHPKEYVMCKPRIDANFKVLGKRKRDYVTPSYPLDSYNFPPGLEFPKDHSLWLTGPSNFGKTNFIEAWLTHLNKTWLMVGSMDRLKQYDDQDVLLFDDLSFTHLDDTQAIQVVDVEKDRSIKCRYHDVHIPAGVIRIFTSNKDIWPLDPAGAISRRIIRHDISTDLRILCPPTN